MTNGTLRSTFRAKLPELVLEALSVMFAVLVALAVDEWRETRSHVELAARADLLIRSEMRHNRAELADNDQENQALLDHLTVVAATPADSTPSLSVDYSISLLTASAWESTRVSQAAQFMELDRVADLSELYELQALFQRAQDGLVDRIANLGDVVSLGPARMAEVVSNQLRVVLRFQEALEEALDEALTDNHSTG